jgi:hypothetical protein
MQGPGEAEVAYARLEALCQAVKGELQQDLHIHDAAVLPNFVNLPQVTAAEYGRVGAPSWRQSTGIVAQYHHLRKELGSPAFPCLAQGQFDSFKRLQAA